MGRKSYKSVKDVPGTIDVAVFAIPAKFVAQALVEVGEKKIPGAVLIPSGFAETGNVEGQKEIQEIGRKYGVRLMGPNIYGFYYTWKNLCATFCTAYDVKGHAALSSQSGGIGMAIIGFSRSAKMGVSAIVGLGNKSDIDEDDLLTFFEQDDNTQIIAMHLEDLKDGRAFAEEAKRVSKKKPVVVLKAGRTAMGARAAASHTGALAGNDKIYEDVFKQSGVIRARSLRDLLEFARAIPVLATPKGENVVIITGAGGSGVLLSDAVVDNGLSLMAMPPDLDAAFRKFIPPFGAAGNPVDITGGEPPKTYQNTVRLGLEDPRIQLVALGPGPAEEGQQRLVRVENAVRLQLPTMDAHASAELRSVGPEHGDIQVLEPVSARLVGPGQEGEHHVVVVLQRRRRHQVALALQAEVLVGGLHGRPAALAGAGRLPGARSSGLSRGSSCSPRA